jgi:hypothetical protein
MVNNYDLIGYHAISYNLKPKPLTLTTWPSFHEQPSNLG